MTRSRIIRFSVEPNALRAAASSTGSSMDSSISIAAHAASSAVLRSALLDMETTSVSGTRLNSATRSNNSDG